MSAIRLEAQPAVLTEYVAIDLTVCGIKFEYDEVRVRYEWWNLGSVGSVDEYGRKREPDEHGGPEILSVEIGKWDPHSRKTCFVDVLEILSDEQLEAIEREVCQ